MKKLALSTMLFVLMSFKPLMAFDAFVVKNIKVEGTQRMSKDAVLQDLPINVGEEVTQTKATAAIHELFQTGFYSDVTLEREGNTLIVKVVERPSIGKLELTGLKTKEDVNKILKENDVAEGRVYDPNVIAKVEREIIHYYLTKQRYGVKVDTKVTPVDRNRVDIVMDIYEGSVATIKEIKFVGNHAFTEKQLRAQMYHKTTNWLSWFDKSDHYSKEKLAADLDMLRSFYMDHGYINFKIESTQVSLSVDKKYVYFTINVSEGEQYFFKKLVIEGDTVINHDTLQAEADKFVKSGAVFSRKKVIEAKETLEDMLGSEGYSKAVIRLVDDVDDSTRTVTLKFYIDAHKRITVRRITFLGNTLTQDQVIRREVEQFEGSWISTKKIKESKEAIMREGYASNVDVQTKSVLDKDDQVDLVYKIDEQRTAQLSAGISYSAAERLGFNLGADLKNFVGTGKDINFLFNYGRSVQIYTLGYNNPYFTDSGVGFGYNIYNQKTNLSKTSNVFNYAMDTTGFNVGWQFRITQFNYIKFSLGVDHSVLKMNYATAPTQAQAFVRAYNNNQGYSNGNMSQGYKEFFGNLAWIHNSLDSYLFPNKGFSTAIDFKFDVPPSELKLYRIDTSTSWFTPVINPVVFNLRGQVGYQDSYNDKPIPFFRHYYLGGAETVRGFEERSLGPKASNNTPYGGNLLVEGRAQFIFPPPFVPDSKSVRMALFLDAGQVYDTGNKRNALTSAPNPRGLRFASGISLLWNTPLHVPISFSLAWPLNKKLGDETKIFAFSLGTQF